MPDDFARFLCPGCSRKCKAPTSAVGKTVRCATCSTSMVVPEAAAGEPSADSSAGDSPSAAGVQWWHHQQPDPPMPSPPAPPAPPALPPAGPPVVPVLRPSNRGDLAEGDGRPVAYKECPFCGEDIRVQARKCKHCGETLDVTLRAAEEARRESRRSRQSVNVRQTTYVDGGYYKAPFNHAIHIVLDVLTCGSWIPIHLICWACH